MELCKVAARLIHDNLPWVLRNGAQIHLWEDQILRKPPLNQHLELNGLKEWIQA
jgi:hypothetical protein